MRKWRLVIDPPLDGRQNMDKDLALLEEVATGLSLPTLRLYRWSPPAVSLGYFQDEKEVLDRAACLAAGVDIVRRPTGGRAVLHDRELTYSIIVPEAHPFIRRGGVLEAYRSISRGILTAFELLGIPAEMTPETKKSSGQAPGSCFDSPSAYEIQVEGRKVVGSAQLRRRGVILQHGSILFSLPLALYGTILRAGPGKEQSEEKPSLEEKAAGLHDLGYPVNCQELTMALIKAFSLVIPAAFTGLERYQTERGTWHD